MDSIMAACCLGLLSLLDFGLGIAEIVVGFVHLHQCPAESRIPVYLLVIGCTGIVTSVVNGLWSRQMRVAQQRPGQESRALLLQPLQQQQSESAGTRGLWGVLTNLLAIFTLVWLICGMVWIFGTKPQFDSPKEPSFCLHPLYVFAQAAVLIRLTVLCLYFLGVCCCICCLGIVATSTASY